MPAKILAWLVPGAGHILQGRVARGLAILAAHAAILLAGAADALYVVTREEGSPAWAATFVLIALIGAAAVLWSWQRRDLAALPRP